MQRKLIDFLWICGVIIFILAAQWFAETCGQMHYEIDGLEHIYDIAHKYLPDLHEHEYIMNIIPLVLIIYTITLPTGWSILKTTFVMLLGVLAIRALTIIATILPKHEKCEVKGNSFFNFLSGGGCYDKIFSGHTAVVTLLGLNLLAAGALNTPMFWGISAVNAFVILLTRAHYTVDVVLGFVISYLVFDGEYNLFKSLFGR